MWMCQYYESLHLQHLITKATQQNRMYAQTTTYQRKDLDPQLSGDILPSDGQM